jgi:hypothetical protein
MYCSGATCELFIWKIPQNVWAENLRNMFSLVISPENKEQDISWTFKGQRSESGGRGREDGRDAE